MCVVLVVDRLVTESTLEATSQSKNRLQHISSSVSEDIIANSSPSWMDTDEGSSRKLVECRICHDEDSDSNMEIPCSCSGSLKYAHRTCVQRWCNEKGDTICEICRQLFKPGYSAPSLPSHYAGFPISFRRDLTNTDFLDMIPMDPEFYDPDFDEYAAYNSRSLICCRVVAIIFTVLLVLRHTLPVIITGTRENSATTVMLLTLRIIGILLPIYIMVKAFTAVQRHRRQLQGSHGTSPRHNPLNGENELPLRYPRPHVIHLG